MYLSSGSFTIIIVLFVSWNVFSAYLVDEWFKGKDLKTYVITNIVVGLVFFGIFLGINI